MYTYVKFPIKLKCVFVAFRKTVEDLGRVLKTFLILCCYFCGLCDLLSLLLITSQALYHHARPLLT